MKNLYETKNYIFLKSILGDHTDEFIKVLKALVHGKVYPRIFNLYGPSGSGKTTLLDWYDKFLKTASVTLPAPVWDGTETEIPNCPMIFVSYAPLFPENLHVINVETELKKNVLHWDRILKELPLFIEELKNIKVIKVI